MESLRTGVSFSQNGLHGWTVGRKEVSVKCEVGKSMALEWQMLINLKQNECTLSAEDRVLCNVRVFLASVHGAGCGFCRNLYLSVVLFHFVRNDNALWINKHTHRYVRASAMVV